MAARRRVRVREPSTGEILIAAASPQSSIPSATAVRVAHAVTPPLTPKAPTNGRAPALPALNVEVLVANIIRTMEYASAQAAGAAANASAIAMTKALEAALARVTEAATKYGAAATLDAAFLKTLETAFVEAMKTSAPITGAAIEAAATKALANVLAPVRERLGALAQQFFRPPGPSTMRTFLLPFIGDPFSQAVRVGTAGREPYEVVVRTVAPPGAFGIFSFDANELNTMDLEVVAPGVTGPPTGGDVLVIPGGQFQIIRLRPGQGLFAKGNIGPGAAIPPEGVIISITGGDFTAGLTAGMMPSVLVAG